MSIKYNKIIYKFLSTHFLKIFGIVFFSISILIALFAIINKGSNFLNKGIPYTVVLQFAIQDIFTAINLILPLSILISTIILFYKLSKTNELIILRSVGLSVWQFISPIIIICFFIGMINLIIFNPLNVIIKRHTTKVSYKYKITNINPLSFSQNGLWLKEKSEKTQAFINVEYLKKENSELFGKNILIFTTDLDNKFLKKIEAETGVLVNNILTLNNVRETDNKFKSISVPEYKYTTNLTIEKIENTSNTPDSFLFWDLPAFIDFFERAGFSAKKYISYLYILIFAPIIYISMVFVATLFSISNKRNQLYIIIKLFLGIVLGFILFFIEQVFIALGISGRIPVLLSIIGIPITSILFCINLLLHSEDG